MRLARLLFCLSPLGLAGTWSGFLVDSRCYSVAVRACRALTLRPKRAALPGLKWLLLPVAVALIAVRAWPAMSVVVLGAPNNEPGRIPPDWHVREHAGRAIVASCAANEGFCVRLASQNSSFALEHRVDVDPAALPFLAWRWKVTRLPEAGDFRKSSTDDQAAQLLVAFSDHRVLSYIWDSHAPRGMMQNARTIPLVHLVVVVCESGQGELNRWIDESRNVAADYEHAFGKPAPHIKGLRLQINTQHTGGRAESYFGQVAFRSTAE
jgi:hypothetical protein